VIAATMNDSEIDGPVMLPAVDAVIVKMPAPIHHRHTEDDQIPPSEILTQLRLGIVGVSDRLFDGLGSPCQSNPSHPSPFRIFRRSISLSRFAGEYPVLS
jgi:hypothetical protein